MLKPFLFISLCTAGFCQENDVAKISEAMGHIIGKNLESFGLDFDMDAIVKGLKEEFEGKKSPLNDDECVQAIVNLQEEKIAARSEQELEQIDAISNGDEVQENEDHPFPATDSSKYR